MQHINVEWRKRGGRETFFSPTHQPPAYTHTTPGSLCVTGNVTSALCSPWKRHSQHTLCALGPSIDAVQQGSVQALCGCPRPWGLQMKPSQGFSSSAYVTSMSLVRCQLEDRGRRNPWIFLSSTWDKTTEKAFVQSLWRSVITDFYITVMLYAKQTKHYSGLIFGCTSLTPAKF